MAGIVLDLNPRCKIFSDHCTAFLDYKTRRLRLPLPIVIALKMHRGIMREVTIVFPGIKKVLDPVHIELDFVFIVVQQAQADERGC